MDNYNGMTVYRKLYHFEGTRQTLAINEITQEVCLIKVLSVYNRAVFDYLMTHPNRHIPRIYAIFEKDRELTLVEEYISGRTLEQILTEHSLPEEEALDLMLQLCDGLMFLHGAEPPIIHRDLKAANLMVTHDGVLKIIDYDAAKLYRPEESRDTILIGTEGHAAPEQYGFGQSDRRTDIYAAGILMRELFAPDSPYSSVIRKATEIDPKNRYAGAGALKNALLQVQRHKARFKEHRFLISARFPGQHFSTGRPSAGHLSPLLPLPGFRTRTLWKECTAILIYLLLAALTIRIAITPSKGPADILLGHIAIGAMALSGVEIFADWTGIFRAVPGYRSAKPILRLAVRVLLFAGVCLWLIILYCILKTILYGN